MAVLTKQLRWVLLVLTCIFHSIVLTQQVGLRYVREHGANLIRVLTFDKNRGKGGAVRMVSMNKLEYTYKNVILCCREC